MAAGKSAPSSSRTGQSPSTAAAGKSGGARAKVTTGVSVAQPELAPLLGAENKAHEQVFGSRHTLAAGSPGRVLMLEFLVCFTILGLGTVVAPSGSKDGVPRMMSRGTGLCLLFFILGLGASAGPGARRAANGLGGLVTVAYLVTSTDAHNVFAWISGYFSTGGVATTTAATGAAAAGAGIGDVAGAATGAGVGIGSVAGAAE